MRHHPTYRPVEGSGVTIETATGPVRCVWCGYTMTPAVPRLAWSVPDIVVTYRGQPTCGRCGLQFGVITAEGA